MLTPAQKQLVEDNHGLIYSFMIKRKLPQDEFYDLCAIGLCKAAATYEPDKGLFSSYAYRAMQNETSHYFIVQGHQNHKHDPCLSLDAPMCEDGTSFIGSLQSDQDFTQAEVAEDIRYMTKSQRKVINLLYRGFNQNEIAVINHRSRQSVNQSVKIIRAQLRYEGATC